MNILNNPISHLSYYITIITKKTPYMDAFFILYTYDWHKLNNHFDTLFS